jgi:mitochondrial fission protein ELM1
MKSFFFALFILPVMAFATPQAVIINSKNTSELNTMVAVAKSLGMTYEVREIKQLYSTPGKPELIMHASRDDYAVSRMVEYKKRNPGTMIVNFGDPKVNRTDFDLIVSPSYLGRLPEGKVFYSEGMASDVSERIAEIPKRTDYDRVFVFIGGHTKEVPYKRIYARDLAQKLNELRAARPDLRFTVVSSKRTPDSGEAAFAEVFKPVTGDVVATQDYIKKMETLIKKPCLQLSTPLLLAMPYP